MSFPSSAANEPRKLFYSVKLFVLTLLLLGAGAGLYGIGRHRQASGDEDGP